MGKYLIIVWLKSWLLLFALLQGVVAAGDPVAGAGKAAPCAACHGADGNSTYGEWPKLAGQHVTYLITQMQAYQQGEDGGRYDEVMTPLMAPLSSQDIHDLAAFYAQQEMTQEAADAAWVTRGELLYRGGDYAKNISACIACHGPNGLGNEAAGFPRVAGQHVDYLVKELAEYRDGERTTDYNCIMRDIAARMSKEDMHAVASYISGLY